MHIQREKGRVTRKRQNENPVRMSAQNPGPSGSAEHRTIVILVQNFREKERRGGRER